MSRAETVFREAFERLKRGASIRLPKGTHVSQNNIAKEAGLDPSALKKSRFPGLIAEVQQWLSEHGRQKPPSQRQKLLAKRSHSRDVRQRLKDLVAQRDKAFAVLVEADARILELTIENRRLEALVPGSNVSPIKGAKPTT